jgi:hypothetical protein
MPIVVVSLLLSALSRTLPYIVVALLTVVVFGSPAKSFPQAVQIACIAATLWLSMKQILSGSLEGSFPQPVDLAAMALTCLLGARIFSVLVG